MPQLLVALFFIVTLMATLAGRGDEGASQLREQEQVVGAVVQQVDEIVGVMRYNQRRYGTIEVSHGVSAGLATAQPAPDVVDEYSTAVRSIADVLMGSAAAGVPGAYAPASTSFDAVSPNQPSASPYNIPVGFGITSCANVSLAAQLGAVCDDTPSANQRILVLEMRANLQDSRANAVPLDALQAHVGEAVRRLAYRYGSAVRDSNNSNLIYVSTGLF